MDTITAVLKAWGDSAEKLVTGEATHFLFPQRYKKHIGKEVLLGRGKEEIALGVVKLGKAEPIHVDDLAKAEESHRMDLTEVKKRWPSARQFWLYPVEVIQRYEEGLEYAAGTESGSWGSPATLRQKTTSSVLCFYHRDLDGVASAAVVKQAHPGAELIDINYGEPFPWEKLEGRELVYMVDFALQPFAEMFNLEDLVKEAGGEFVWIDHHKTSLEHAEEAEFSPPGLRELDKAGCELTWKYLNPDSETPPAVHYVGRFDVWDHSDPETMPIKFGLESMEEVEDPASSWWEDQLKVTRGNLDSVAADGKVIQRWFDKFNAGVMKAISFPMKFAGLDMVAAVTSMSGSTQFESVAEDRDAAMALKFTGDQWTISLYSLREGVDVSEVADSFGGGGHPGAAGFQTQELPFSLPKRAKKIQEPDPNVDDFGISWNAQIMKRSPEKRLVTAVVLKPETTDAQGTVMSDDVIQEAAHNFVMKLISGKAKGIGYMHREFGRNLKLVESFVAPEVMTIGGQMVPKGSWVMRVKVFDDEIWKRVMNGEIRGFSIGGKARVSRVL